jgi:hypothetical protein
MAAWRLAFAISSMKLSLLFDSASVLAQGLERQPLICVRWSPIAGIE